MSDAVVFNEANNNSGKHKLSNKKKLLLVLVVLTILAGVVGFITFKIIKNNNSQKQAMENICSANPSLIDKASIAMGKSDKDTLQKLTDETKTKKGYENDQNCLFLITFNDITKADNASAEANFTKYNQIFKEEKASVAGTKTKYKWNKDSLKQRLDFSKAFSENLIENNKKLSHPNNLEPKQ